MKSYSLYVIFLLLFCVIRNGGVNASDFDKPNGEPDKNAEEAEPGKKISRNDQIGFLKTTGFTESEDKGVWKIERIKVGELLKRLGAKSEDMRPTVSQPDRSDIRLLKNMGIYFIITSQMKDKDGWVVNKSLDNADCPCTVHAVLTKD